MKLSGVLAAPVPNPNVSHEEFELRGYLRDGEGRLISHVRLHRELRRA